MNALAGSRPRGRRDVRGPALGATAAARRPTGAAAVAAGPPAVVVVDDDPSVRKALQRLFRSEGYAVETFTNATDFLAHERPQAGCLVLDIRMPGISGLDLQQQVVTTRPELPIVIITGHADAETRQRALEAGAVAVLYKPFDEEALLAAVARALGGGRRS